MTSKISVIRYYSLSEALTSETEGTRPFIIANEVLKKNADKTKHEVGRYYSVLPSFKIFLKNRDKFLHCHELLVDHQKAEPDLSGRLVFDFDLPVEPPSDFKQQVEDTIIDVIDTYYKKVDSNKFIYVWSTSENPKKFSKHLTVKNCYFDDWIYHCKIFYKLFCLQWRYTWIKKSKLIDFQIVRKKASLRMCGSSKINGYPLVLDNKEHTLTDSLIRIYLNKEREVEQLITKKNIIPSVFTEFIDDISETSSQQRSERSDKSSCSQREQEAVSQAYEDSIYKLVFKFFNYISKNIFREGKITGTKLSLMRINPAKCMICGRIHEQENAYLEIVKKEAFYSIYFVCYRAKSNKMFLGTIGLNDENFTYDPNFEGMKKIYKAGLRKSKKLNKV